MEEKSINRYHSFGRSLENLKEARLQDGNDKFVLSGTVQMFNLFFDLSWKVMKDSIIQYHGVTDFATSSPRETLQTARNVGLMEDDIWITMLWVRNNLVHDYDGELARKYFVIIISEYYDKMDELRNRISKYYTNQ